MANYTPIMNLLKPLESDKYDVNLRNENWQKIDDFFGNLQKSLNDHKELNELDHPDSCVTTRKLKDKSVTTPKIADKSITAEKLSDDINTKLDDSYVEKSGDTMSGDLKLENGSGIVIKSGNNQDWHKINQRGPNGQYFDFGDPAKTERSNLACRFRPEWFAGLGNPNNGPLMKLTDISISYGNIKDGQMLPVPQGFEESECQWLLSMEQSNIEKWLWDINERGAYNMVNLECWRSGRKVHVGTRFKGQDSLWKDNNYIGNGGAETWIPGSANFICIAVKKV